MTVNVKMFAAARQLAGASSIDVELNAGGTVGELRIRLLDAAPGLRPLAGQLAIAVNSSYAADELRIPAGAEVACLPPVSGG